VGRPPSTIRESQRPTGPSADLAMAERHRLRRPGQEDKSVSSPIVSREGVGVAAADTQMAEEVESEYDTEGSA
jgi:hypothetical protein